MRISQMGPIEHTVSIKLCMRIREVLNASARLQQNTDQPDRGSACVAASEALHVSWKPFIYCIHSVYYISGHKPC